MLDQIRELSQSFIKKKYEAYRRYFIKTHPLQHRFTILLGERGIGKTTTLMQILMDASNQDLTSEEILYVQADHFLIQKKSLYEIAETFFRYGGKTIAFDEIHKYPDWSMELKSIYDTFTDLRIIASGSSALEIHKGTHDLSRRAIVFRMKGLSFREFIGIRYGIEMSSVTFDDILTKHSIVALEITNRLETANLKILKLFSDYLEWGYYPYFREVQNRDEFKMTLEQNLHTTLESDLVAIYPHLTGNSIKKIKQLLVYIAQSVPFIPNWQKIKQIAEIGDDRTVKTYFKYLEDASIIRTLSTKGTKLKHVEASQKVFLSNPNQLYAYSSLHPNLGTVRETFFMSMINLKHNICANKKTDFCIDQNYFFEVGGKNKNNQQIQNLDHAYLALDGIEHGSGNRIPLWIFGFLY